LGAFFVAYAAPEPELGNGMERNGSTWPLDEQLAICDYRSAASSQCPCTYKVHLSSRSDEVQLRINKSTNALIAPFNGQKINKSAGVDVDWLH